MKLLNQTLFLLLALSLLGSAHGHVGGEPVEVECHSAGPSEPISAVFVANGSTPLEAISAATDLAELEMGLSWSCKKDCPISETSHDFDVDYGGILSLSFSETFHFVSCIGEVDWLNTTWTPNLSQTGDGWTCSMQVTGDYSYECYGCPLM